MSTEDSIEQEIQAKGLTAPRVTPEDIEANIASEWYFTGAEGVAGNLDYDSNAEVPSSLTVLTLCTLVLCNGFIVVGKSACASPENFDADLGRKIARQDAVNQVWPLMGYALKERLQAAQTSV